METATSNEAGRPACRTGWLDGYVTVVTGATSGIGRAIVDRYVSEGAGVVAHGRNAEDVEELLDAYGDAVVGCHGDITDFNTSEACVDAAVDAFGKLDVFVGNAGIFDFFRPLEKYDPATLDAALDEVFAVNVKGYLYGAMAAAPALRASKGTLIYTASIAGFHASCGGIVYTAAKHAIVGLVRQLAFEYAPDIRVNAVGPGGTLTPLSGPKSTGQSERSILDNPNVGERVAASVPLGFAQLPEHHAGLYVLLGSRENAPAVTGQVFMSDGGVGVRRV